MPRRPVAQSPARRALVQMMGTVIVVHVLAIAVYRLAGLAQGPQGTVQIFGAIWTAVTVVVVGIGLFRVRAARLAALAERRAGRGADQPDRTDRTDRTDARS